MALKDLTAVKGNDPSTAYPKDVQALTDALIEAQAKITALVTLTTELKADQATLLAKLDADAGVTDTNYAATCATAAATVTV